jgi:mono/diheme cytochrome c family protein
VNKAFSVGILILILMLMSTNALATDGETLFKDTCAPCHQGGGVGSPGLAPPLVDKILWDRLGSRAPAYIAGVMLAGFSGTIEVSGLKYSGLVMSPQGQLTDDQLAAIGNYVLSKLNDSREELVPSAVASLRAAPPSHTRLREMRRMGS